MLSVVKLLLTPTGRVAVTAIYHHREHREHRGHAARGETLASRIDRCWHPIPVHPEHKCKALSGLSDLSGKNSSDTYRQGRSNSHLSPLRTQRALRPCRAQVSPWRRASIGIGNSSPFGSEHKSQALSGLSALSGKNSSDTYRQARDNSHLSPLRTQRAQRPCRAQVSPWRRASKGIVTSSQFGSEHKCQALSGLFCGCIQLAALSGENSSDTYRQDRGNSHLSPLRTQRAQRPCRAQVSSWHQAWIGIVNSS